MAIMIASSLSAFSLWGLGEKEPPKVTIKAVRTLDTSIEARKALAYLNELRYRAGMSKFLYNKTLQTSALSHANYLTDHEEIGHFEERGKVGFTGVMPKDRVKYAGYLSTMSMENVSNQTIGYKASVDGLFSAIYHRFGFLDFQVDEIGIGVSQNPDKKDQVAYVYNMGIYEINDLCHEPSYRGRGEYIYNVCIDSKHRIEKKAFNAGYKACYIRNKKIVIYPFDGQEEVPPAFFDELPDPLPEYRVSGFPISVQFNPQKYPYVHLKSFELYHDSKLVTCKTYDAISDINYMLKRNEFALFPLKRLEWDSRYEVRLVYEHRGKTYTKTWHFQTKKLPSKPIMITKKSTKVTLHQHSPMVLYFPPKDGNDILGDALYDTALDVTFIDKNTLLVRTSAKVGASYSLKISGRDIQILVAP